MIRKLGKKGLEWKRERLQRIKELAKTGKYEIIKTLLYGPCKDCGKHSSLDLDHIQGRHITNPHDMSNLEAICRECHQKRHMNTSEKKESNKNQKTKKADWTKEHVCKYCKKTLSTLLCTCGKLSI